jgi:urease accessory protein
MSRQRDGEFRSWPVASLQPNAGKRRSEMLPAFVPTFGSPDTGIVFVMPFLAKFTALAAAFFFSTIAHAHHPMGGETPSTLAAGLLSGIGHPIIGLDHLAFILAVGIAATLSPRRFLMPLAFVAATVTGTLLHLQSVGLPFVELVIVLSVAGLGLMLMSGRWFSPAAYAAVFAVAGLFHGHAYGEAVFGAETTPVLAYLTGFGLTQYLIAIAAGAAFSAVAGLARPSAPDMALRLSGAMVAGVGALLAGEHVLALAGLA